MQTGTEAMKARMNPPAIQIGDRADWTAAATNMAAMNIGIRNEKAIMKRRRQPGPQRSIPKNGGSIIANATLANPSSSDSAATATAIRDPSDNRQAN